MTNAPLTDQQHADIRARHNVYMKWHSPGAFACCTAHASADDVPTLLAEIDRLRAELAAEERRHLQTIDERDRAAEMANKLAATIAPFDIIGEHSSMNDPWQNAIDHAYDTRTVKP